MMQDMTANCHMAEAWLLTSVWAKNSAAQNKIRNLLSNSGVFLFIVIFFCNDLM